MEPILCRPIAFVHSPYRQRIDAPHQATVVEGTETGRAMEAEIHLEDWVPEKALKGLEGFERIWAIFAFHRSEGWAPLVKPPRGQGRKGVLATRSPHRPNPIGLSALELVSVEDRVIRVRGVDLLDGTPILDLKPYVPYADAFPASRAGWIDEVDAETGRQWAPGPRKPRRSAGQDAAEHGRAGLTQVDREARGHGAEDDDHPGIGPLEPEQ
ncbi:MAG: hypothetical protein H6Q00_3347 [Holophagaceae bacterium]|nr:hypothetical protein [Holophagaceae bacterium]